MSPATAPVIYLTPAGKDRWTALDGSYTAERRTDTGGWAYGGIAYLVTAVRLPAADKARYLRCGVAGRGAGRDHRSQPGGSVAVMSKTSAPTGRESR